ncbi:MAG: PKD domain-containing protein, partial [Bacteroidota bacterium]|nr:PKD domain-containing protein [Bacteroidota bacterium]
DTMLVKDNQADVYAGPDQIIYVDNAKLAGNKPIRGAGIWSLDAGAGTIVSPSTYETNVTGLGEGVNTFKWSIDIDGCISSSSVKVSYYRKPVPVFSASTEEGCAPLTVKLTNTTIGNYPFQWSLGESGIISADASPVYTYTTPGTYTVKLMVTGPDGQLVTAMKTITVHPVPKAKFDVVTKDLYIPGDELRCYNTSEGAENWLWNFGDGTSSADFNGVHTYADSGVYNIKLVALSSYLCKDSVTITNAVHVIERSSIKFPSAFTPNPNGSSNGRYNRNDYSNDVFYPIVIMNGIQDYHMEIYNRWGVLVFESNDIEIGWDGYYKGKLLTQDVYIYRVSGFYNNGKRFSFAGDVLLMRK